MSPLAASRTEAPPIPLTGTKTADAQQASHAWADTPIRDRLAILRRARHAIAADPTPFAAAISPALARSTADTLVSEVLPLLDALRFLERRAVHILAPQHLGRKGRPLWLSGVDAEVHRAPLGHVLVIGPANFPLFLPGVQTAQALAAGNTVTWKPGAGGQPVAALFAAALFHAGLPRTALTLTADTVEAAEQALAQHPAKVVFTGSATTGQRILHTLADTVTPAIMELSGADAVLVLPSANLEAVAQAVAFGLRLNGGEVCMSPRRLIATADTLAALKPLLLEKLAAVPLVPLRSASAAQLGSLLDDAVAGGAQLLGAFSPEAQSPLLLEGVTPGMNIARSDLFAPVLSLIESPSVDAFAALANRNPFGLTAAIFGNAAEAAALAARLHVGTVLINDLIAPTADPRVPFGGTKGSGFGVTRGADGLLAVTTPQVLLRRNRPSLRPYQPLSDRQTPFFASLISTLHGGSLKQRLRGIRSLLTTARP